MDIISFNEASTANGRIENFNANPDSTSGIVTQPSIIQSGEIVSIPAGRTAIMANTVIDGTINLDGTMFIPSGSSVDFTNGITVNGNSISLSIPTSYHLLQGNLSVSNEVITNGFSTTLFTGKSTTQSVVTGIDMSTQWGNDVSETFGGLVWYKDRVTAGAGHVLYDTIRGINKYVQTNTISAEGTLTDGLLSFNNDGFNVGTNCILNAPVVSWNFQTTHRRTGVTNHGKAYTEHYNPFTGFTMIKYEGSGLDGHEIPHSLCRKLGLRFHKSLTSAIGWVVLGSVLGNVNFLNLHTNDALFGSYSNIDTDTSCILSVQADNTSGTTQIMYGWANSYLNESNKLIGNYEIGVYQGTGAIGNKVTTRGKPAWVMLKRLDSKASWIIVDNIRGDNELYPNLSNIEASYDRINIVADGFIFSNGDTNGNASGGQYLYMVVYDNDSGSGKSKYPKATDTSNVQINNALIPLAHGIDSNGSKNSIVIANETITGLTYIQGKNYLYKTDTGYGVKSIQPRYLSSELVRRFAGENPDYYDIESNKWFNCDSGTELIANGTGLSLTGWNGTSYNGSINVADSSVLTLSNQTFSLLNATGKTYAGMIQQISGFTIGLKYKLVFDVQNSSLGINVGALQNSYIGILNSEAHIYQNGNNQVYEFTASDTSLYIYFVNYSSVAGHTSKVDNISLFEKDIIPTTEITESRNYLNHIIHADQNGQVAYVEELPKIEYKDIIKANEYQGKNACTAWVVYDSTTTPPTIINSYNINSIIRISSGVCDLYFSEEMDIKSYSVSGLKMDASSNLDGHINIYYPANTTKKLQIHCIENNTGVNSQYVSVQVFGGKNS